MGGGNSGAHILAVGMRDRFGKQKRSCASVGCSAGTASGTASPSSVMIVLRTSVCAMPHPSPSKAVAHVRSSRTRAMLSTIHSSNPATFSSPFAERIRSSWYAFCNCTLYHRKAYVSSGCIHRVILAGITTARRPHAAHAANTRTWRCGLHASKNNNGCTSDMKGASAATSHCTI